MLVKEVEVLAEGSFLVGKLNHTNSIYGGFVKWEMGTRADGFDSIAVQVCFSYFKFTIRLHQKLSGQKLRY